MTPPPPPRRRAPNLSSDADTDSTAKVSAPATSPQSGPSKTASPEKGATEPGAGAKGKGGTAGRAKTPMMEQFWRAKDEQPDAILFFRMGDFYEMFGEDAVVVSRELGITLTQRDKGPNAMPMAGVPVRAAEGHLLRLVRKGFRVAICEQLTDPKASKGIVERGIVRVVTAGTITEEDALDARASNYLACASVGAKRAGLVWVDLSTGRLHASECEIAKLPDELSRIAPAEVLLSSGLAAERPELWVELERALGNAGITEREPWRFEREAMARAAKRQFKVKTLEGFGIEDKSEIVPAVGACIEYLEETQKTACEHVRRIERVEPGRFLVLDRATRGCLELVETQRGARREGTLLDGLDTTRTAMGGRLLREWVLEPLCEVDPILHRQRGVAELVEQPFVREELRSILSEVRDLERLTAKISTGRVNARDLVALGQSLAQVPMLKQHLADRYSAILPELDAQLDPLTDVTERIGTTLVDEPPLTIKEGGVVRSGFHTELDELRQIAGDGKTWMAKFQADESVRAGNPGLKIGFNSVFGYFLEVPRGQVDKVPDTYIRKQTIKTAERYITPELKEFEQKVLKAEDLAKDLEYGIFNELRDELSDAVGRILDTARAVATVDCLASLAETAAQNRYVAPAIDDSGELEILEGRHPVIERSAACDSFVPNDTRLDGEQRSLALLTGPNMAGKSTYIRQIALIVLMAQMGSFVPADSARIGITDRIFTRVGSGDDISRGESTFMVEMVEIANILNNATARSLVVLDEVGRGTSTFDGLALAWAIVEHVHGQVGARTLFATHYHQLTELAERLKGVHNLSVAVREWEDEIVFLHKIVEGGTDRSYGIHVARLAGVPPEVLSRAKAVLAEIEGESEHLAPRIAGSASPVAEAQIAEAPVSGPASTPAESASEARPTPSNEPQQLALFAAEPSRVERELAALDPDSMTPMEALLAIQRLKAQL